MTDWPRGIAAVTLFVADVRAARDWYAQAFDQSTVFEDHHSAVFRFGETVVNLLDISQADQLVAPSAVAPHGTGTRQMLTLEVEDVDATCATLRRRGVELLNGPANRPWGIRTAAFQDLDGHVWEVAR